MARKDGKTLLTVVTDYGTFTRTTARTYAFLIAVRALKPSWLKARREADRAELTKDIKHYSEVVLSGVVPAQYASSSSIDSYKRYLEDSIQALANLDAKYAAQLKDNAHQATLPMGPQASWSAKLWNAEAEARKLAEHHNEVRIFDATTGKLVRTYGPFETI